MFRQFEWGLYTTSKMHLILVFDQFKWDFQDFPIISINTCSSVINNQAFQSKSKGKSDASSHIITIHNATKCDLLTLTGGDRLEKLRNGSRVWVRRQWRVDLSKHIDPSRLHPKQRDIHETETSMCVIQHRTVWHHPPACVSEWSAMF